MDPSVSKSFAADSSPNSSPLCSPKEKGSTSSSPGAPSSPLSYTMASGRKDSSDSQPRSPYLNEQQKSHASPSPTPRPIPTSTKTHRSHSGSKSRFPDPKCRKACLPQSPLAHPKSSKPEKDQEDVKKTEYQRKDKPQKKERKNEAEKANRTDEERKRQKKKEKHSRKRDKEFKKDRKFSTKSEKSKTEGSSSSASLCPGEAKLRKGGASSLSPDGQSQSSLKHKRRERSERAAERTTSTSPSTKTPRPSCTSQHSTSKSNKMPKKKCSPPQSSVSELPTASPSNYSGTKQTSSAMSSEDGPKTNFNGTFPSSMGKTPELLSTACSIDVEQAIRSKDDGQGGVLHAPDLQPEAVLGTLVDSGDTHSNTPPVLSWQGSPVSDLEEEDGELEKGVISRPVLQPSPTQCFSPLPADSESSEDTGREPCFDALNEDSRNDTAELCDPPCAIKQDVKEDKKEQGDAGGKTAGSLVSGFHQHKAGLDDVFKSLANFLGSQRAACRGGPFGRAFTKRVMYSSSLATVPQIHDCENQDLSPKPTPTPSSESSNQSPSDTTSNSLLKFHTPYLKEPVKIQEKQEKSESSTKETQEERLTENLLEKTESSLLEGSLSAELRVTTTHRASFTSVISVSTKEERESRKETGHTTANRKRKQKAKDMGRGAEIKTKIKANKRKVKNKVKKATELGKRGVSSSVSVVSRLLADSTKGQIPQENQPPHGKGIKRVRLDTGNTDANMAADVKVEDSEMETKATSDSNTSNSTISTSKSGATKPTSSPPRSKAPVDPLRLKALSMGLSKELKIILVKMDCAGRQTFNISELEERRIPLSEIDIQNTATEVISACK